MTNPEIVLENLSEDLEATLQLGYAWISRGSLDTARDVFDGLTRLPLESGEAQQVGLGLIRIGDVLMELLDYPGALIAYRAGLEIRREPLQRDPSHTDWQCKLSLTHDRIGILLEAQGNGRGALAAYSTALEIRNTLTKRDPNNTEWYQNLSWTHNRIGDVLMAQGDCPGALAAYRGGLDIAQSLVQRDPENVEWQHDLSISHNKIGDALVGQGDSRSARAAFLAGLEILEALARQDSQNTRSQLDIAFFCAKLGSLDCLMVRTVRRDYWRRSRDILVSLKSQGRSGVNDELIDVLDAALKSTSWLSWNTTRAGLKVVGTGLLAVHIIRSSFIVEPGLVAMYLTIVLSVGFVFVLVIYPAVDWASGTQQLDYPVMNEQATSEIKRHPIRLALLIPGEDGIFFVPLLWVGITPLTAGVAAAAFAAVHYPEYSIRASAPKFVFLFGIAMMVLPHGIGSVVVGHLLVDAMMLLSFKLTGDD